MIIGGSNNYIAAGAVSIQLINCTNVVVNGDVLNFVGIGLSNITITNSLSNKKVTAPDAEVVLTSNTTLDITYHNKNVYLDGSGGAFTIKWDCATMADCHINFIRMDNVPGNHIILDSTAYFGTENYVGHATPYNLGLVQYSNIELTSRGDTIYNV